MNGYEVFKEQFYFSQKAKISLIASPLYTTTSFKGQEKSEKTY